METSAQNIAFDVDNIRKDFPILNTKSHGKPFIYFDNAATSQKPQAVINALADYYCKLNANVHRGFYELSLKASEAYDNAKLKVKEFINAASEKEIIFTRGTTEAINLIAYSYGLEFLGQNDEIIISEMEHHANIVPWQVLCQKKNASLKVIPINERGEILIDELENLITERTKIVSVCHVSNTLGTINPVNKITELVKRKNKNIIVVIDGAQAVPHKQVNVLDIGCDFYAFSSHKMYGPMGIGVLYGRAELLENMPPYQTGGDMISYVSFKKTEYNEIPMKFEAGTQNVEGAVGLNAAIDYIHSIGYENIFNREHELLQYATNKIKEIDGIKIIGTAEKKSAVISFIIEGLNSFDIGVLLDTYGIAVRTGQHCTQPLMDKFNIPAAARASFAFYNTFSEIDFFIDSLHKAIRILKQ